MDRTAHTNTERGRTPALRGRGTGTVHGFWCGVLRRAGCGRGAHELGRRLAWLGLGAGVVDRVGTGARRALRTGVLAVVLSGPGLPMAAAAGADLSSPTQAQGGCPPFMARGTVSCNSLNPDGTVRAGLTSLANFSFLYSNGWWQLEEEFVKQCKLLEMAEGTIINIRPIPDGIRELSLSPPERMPPGFTNKAVLEGAIAYGGPFPIPLQAESFLCWLALHPNPQLPIIGPGRIRRLFLPEWMERPDNEGRFRLRYLSGESGFLAELSIWHNGLELLYDGPTRRYPPPFHRGALEFKYEVLEATNWAGMVVPKRARLTRYSHKSNAKSPEDIYPSVVAELTLERIEAWDGTVRTARPLPEEVFASDHRFPGLPRHAALNYRVTNDQWKPVSAPELKALAASYRWAGRRPAPKAPWVLRLAWAAVAIAPLAVWAGYRLLAKANKKPKPNSQPGGHA